MYFSPQLPVIFEDLSVSFTKKALLDPDQETLYWEVVEENYETLLSVGKEFCLPFAGGVLQSTEPVEKGKWANCH